MRIKLLSILILTTAICCKNGKPKNNVLPLDSMKVVMFDFLIADEWNNVRLVTDTTLIKSKNNLKSYQQVLTIHHINKATFDSSLAYYEQHPDIFKILIDSLNNYGTRLRDSAAPKPSKIQMKKAE